MADRNHWAHRLRQRPVGIRRSGRDPSTRVSGGPICDLWRTAVWLLIRLFRGSAPADARLASGVSGVAAGRRRSSPRAGSPGGPIQTRRHGARHRGSVLRRSAGDRVSGRRDSRSCAGRRNRILNAPVFGGGPGVAPSRCHGSAGGTRSSCQERTTGLGAALYGARLPETHHKLAGASGTGFANRVRNSSAAATHIAEAAASTGGYPKRAKIPPASAAATAWHPNDTRILSAEALFRSPAATPFIKNVNIPGSLMY